MWWKNYEKIHICSLLSQPFLFSHPLFINVISLNCFQNRCYPCESGIYPRVFEPDAIHGLLPHETTLAKYLQQRHQYATKIVGKVRMMEGVRFVSFFSFCSIIVVLACGMHCMKECSKFLLLFIVLPLLFSEDINLRAHIIHTYLLTCMVCFALLDMYYSIISNTCFFE